MNIYELTDYCTFEVKILLLEEVLDWYENKAEFAMATIIEIISPFQT